MNLIIDNREKEIKDYFQNHTHVEFKNLDVGDICFYYQDKLILLIERKSITDLASSIKSKRYNEQKLRLMNNIENSKILYLIEGDLNDYGVKIEGISKKAMYSTFISLIIRDNLKLYQTKHIKETIEWIEKIYDKLINNPDKFIQSDKSNSQFKYSECIQLKKKENITPEICFISQLSQIPGVSNKIATHIVNQYKTMGHLCQELIRNPDDLCQFEYTLENNKKRKLGKKGKQIYDFLFQ